MISNDEKQWFDAVPSVACQLSGFIGVPYGNVLGPTSSLKWELWKRNEVRLRLTGKVKSRSISIWFNGDLLSRLKLRAPASSSGGLFVVSSCGIFDRHSFATIQGAIKASNGEH